MASYNGGIDVYAGVKTVGNAMAGAYASLADMMNAGETYKRLEYAMAVFSGKRITKLTEDDSANIVGSSVRKE